MQIYVPVTSPNYCDFKVVHGDLAARNILLDCSWVAKISNFGIGQRHNVQQKSYANQFPKVSGKFKFHTDKTKLYKYWTMCLKCL